MRKKKRRRQRQNKKREPSNKSGMSYSPDLTQLTPGLNRLQEMLPPMESASAQQKPISMQNTPEENMSTPAPRLKRKYTRHQKASQEAGTFGIEGLANNDTPPAGMDESGPPRIQEGRGEDRKLTNDLSSGYALLGMALAGVKPLAGQIVLEKAQERAKELVTASRHSPRLRRVLKRITKAGAYTPLVVGHVSMLVAVMVAADRIPLSPRSAAFLHATGYDTVISAKIAEYNEKQQQQHGTNAARQEQPIPA